MTTGGGYGELELSVPAKPRYLAELRRLVRLFAEEHDLPEGRLNDIVLAVNEACANVVLHAYADEGGPLRLRAWEDSLELAFEVSDNGTPVAKPAPGRAGGLGVPLIKTLSDEVRIEGPGTYGTRLEMRFKK